MKGILSSENICKYLRGSTVFTDRYNEVTSTNTLEKETAPVSTKTAQVLDITDICALSVQYKDGTREKIFTGEISIRIKTVEKSDFV